MAVCRVDLIIHPTVSESAPNVQLVYPATLSSQFWQQAVGAGSASGRIEGDQRSLGRLCERYRLARSLGSGVRRGSEALTVSFCRRRVEVSPKDWPPVDRLLPPGIFGQFDEIARRSCYTSVVQRNLTIKVSEEAILWARRKAVEENTSVSRLVGQMLEGQMRLSDDYWRAFEHWKQNQPLALKGVAERMNREELHERK